MPSPPDESTRPAPRKRTAGLEGWLQHDETRVPVEAGARLVIGRAEAADVCLADESVSWEHAEIVRHAGALHVRDLGSRNGTYVDDAPVTASGVRLRHGARIIVGDQELFYVSRTRAEVTAERPSYPRRYQVADSVSIGRGVENDIVLEDPSISRRHASIEAGRRAVVRDLGSRNGVRVNGHATRGAQEFEAGDEIGIGPYRLEFDGRGLLVIDERAGLQLRAVGTEVRIGDKTILHSTSLTINQGEFVALIGPSGSGKTTLLRTLAGVLEPSSGHVLLADTPVRLRQSDLGYVPQSDVLHDRLTIEESLRFAARLRLPEDTSREELRQGIDEVVDELALTGHRATSIAAASGGQRKRVACGVELIGQPTMLLLDEPTSGLDPPLERQLMQTMRDLADAGRGVVVSTHATSSLALCDVVALMAPGGHLRYVGSPQSALEQYDVRHYDELFATMQDSVDDPVPSTPQASAPLISSPPSTVRRPFFSQFGVLVSRYARTFVRDRRTLAVLLGQVPIMAVLIALLFPSGLLALPDEEPGKSAQFMFLLVTAALWLGLISACREVVRERPIIVREVSVGVRVSAYVLAKATVLFVVAAVQAGLLVAIATLIQPLHEPPAHYVEVFAILTGVCWASIGMGLAISTLARSVDQATSFVPLLLIPQLLFAGALVPVKSMQSAVEALSNLVVARWAFSGTGTSIDMNDRLATEPPQLDTYGSDFFDLEPVVAVMIMAGFAAAGLVLAGALLSRRAKRLA